MARSCTMSWRNPVPADCKDTAPWQIGCTLLDSNRLPLKMRLMKRVYTVALIPGSLLPLHTVAQEKVIRLYDAPAPGSEDWKRTEQESRTNLWRTRVVFNVINPTLTVFQPESGKATGTAVIICPGGAFLVCQLRVKASRWPVGSTRKASPASCSNTDWCNVRLTIQQWN